MTLPVTFHSQTFLLVVMLGELKSLCTESLNAMLDLLVRSKETSVFADSFSFRVNGT